MWIRVLISLSESSPIGNRDGRLGMHKDSVSVPRRMLRHCRVPITVPTSPDLKMAALASRPESEEGIHDDTELIDRRRAWRMIFAVLATAVAATLSAAHAKDDDVEHRGSATYTTGLFGPDDHIIEGVCARRRAANHAAPTSGSRSVSRSISGTSKRSSSAREWVP